MMEIFINMDSTWLQQSGTPLWRPGKFTTNKNTNHPSSPLRHLESYSFYTCTEPTWGFFHPAPLCGMDIFGGGPWWRHQMETFSALLAICAGNSPVPVNSPHKGQWCGALMFCIWINDWVNNGETGDLRRYLGHCNVNVMPPQDVNISQEPCDTFLG